MIKYKLLLLLSSQVWAALLGVRSSHWEEAHERQIAAALSVAASSVTAGGQSNESPDTTESSNVCGLSEQAMSQISVDLPRCHAYDLLIGSPLGQQRLRSVLVASLLANDDKYEYTQVRFTSFYARSLGSLHKLILILFDNKSKYARNQREPGLTERWSIFSFGIL